MMDAFQAFLILIGVCFSAGCIGASFIFGVALVCRQMKWAPFNTTIIINNFDETNRMIGMSEAAE